MRRIGAALAAVAAVLALTASGTLAVLVPGTLDQQEAVTSGDSALWDSGFVVAQTFTSSVDGTLDAVGVYVSVPAAPTPQAHPNTPANVTIYVDDVAKTVGGIPVGVVLALEGLNVDSTPGWVYFILPSPLDIVAGHQYEIAMQASGAAILDWSGDCADSYAGGQAFVFDSVNETSWRTVTEWSAAHSGGAGVCQQDFAFQSYVTAAPSASATLPSATPTSFETFLGQTAAPTIASTPPPTSTTPAGGSGNDGQLALVVLASPAAAAAFVTMRRYGLARR